MKFLLLTSLSEPWYVGSGWHSFCQIWRITRTTFCAGEISQDGLHFLVLHDSTVVLLHGEFIGRLCAFQFVQRLCDAPIIVFCQMTVLLACWFFCVHPHACAVM
jgi:hypothetical protein